MSALEILNGLDKIPVPTSTSSLVVTGPAQVILTGKKAGDVLLAGTKQGNGKILCGSHGCYHFWLDEKENQPIFQMMTKIRNWLTGDDELEDNEKADLSDLINENDSFDSYKLIKWTYDFDISAENQEKLLKYVQNGGSLFVAGTIWAVADNPDSKDIREYSAFKFCKDNAGIFFKDNNFELSEYLDPSDNKAPFGHFDEGLVAFTEDSDLVDQFFSTIESGLEVLAGEGFVSQEKINFLKQKITSKSQNLGVDIIPQYNKPVTGAREQDMCKIIGQCFIHGETEKAYGIDEFPGDFQNGHPQLETNVRLKFKTKYMERLSTGYYLPAGVQLIVKVESGDPNGWRIRIGAHDDDLAADKTEKFQRWPVITSVKKLKHETTLGSPFGGLIYIERYLSTKDKECSISLEISNVIETPFFDVLQPDTIDDWGRRCDAPGLWAELAGEYVIFTTPSKYIRHVNNPLEVVKFWDRVIETHHQCRGTNVRNYKRERIVNDLQPSVGYMHSGYPIVTELDVCQPDNEACIFDINKLNKKGNWGLFHEIGHNMQRDAWNFEGCTEVTCNIFSMHATQILLGQDLINQEWLNDQKDNFEPFFQDPSYKKWQDEHGIALMTFAQLIKHFGWKSMYKFLKDFENDLSNKSSNLPKNNQEIIDQWVIRYSNIVGRNIKPQFEMFSLPVSSEVDQFVSKFPEWCPIEEKDPKVFFSPLGSNVGSVSNDEADGNEHTDNEENDNQSENQENDEESE